MKTILSLMLTLFCVGIVFSQIEDAEVTNIQIGYDENALIVSWDLVPDANYDVDWFNIFYAEAENTHVNMLDSALTWFMHYDDCWEWERCRTYQHRIRIEPNAVFPAYSSTIRIGIMPSTQFFYVQGEMVKDSVTYGRLFLAPDIYNKTPAQTGSVTLEP